VDEPRTWTVASRKSRFGQLVRHDFRGTWAEAREYGRSIEGHDVFLAVATDAVLRPAGPGRRARHRLPRG
jgi:hypothetical protein